jgi:transcription termination/antitermination protein NusG
MLEEKRDDTGTQEAPAEQVAQEPEANDSPDRAPVVSPFQAASAPEPAEEPELEQASEDESELDEAPEPEAEAAPVGAPVDLEAPANPKLKWFAVHTYSGHENKVRTNLLRRVLMEGLEDKIGQVLVPTEEVTEMKQGKKSVTTRKYFPSYILVEMEMCDEAYHLVNQISGVTRFVGLDPRDTSKRPVPLRPHEVDRVLGRIAQPSEHRVADIPYQVGDQVHVIDGPFSDFNGVVDDVNAERGTLKVMVTIFGRETPVELDFLQVEPV